MLARKARIGSFEALNRTELLLKNVGFFSDSREPQLLLALMRAGDMLNPKNSSLLLDFIQHEIDTRCDGFDQVLRISKFAFFDIHTEFTKRPSWIDSHLNPALLRVAKDTNVIRSSVVTIPFTERVD
jgi:hypothetical protein